jgi:hypothetical protein
MTQMVNPKPIAIRCVAGHWMLLEQCDSEGMQFFLKLVVRVINRHLDGFKV